jgi:hypothetical protein
MYIVHFMSLVHFNEQSSLHDNITLLYKAFTSCLYPTFVGVWDFMLINHLGEGELLHAPRDELGALHGSPSPLWRFSTSCLCITLCAVMILHVSTLPYVNLFHFMIVNHLWQLVYFMILTYFNAWLALHAGTSLLWMPSTSCLAYTLMEITHFMYPAHLYATVILHAIMLL